MKEKSGKEKVEIVAPGRQSEGGIRTVVSNIYPVICKEPDFEFYWLPAHCSGSAFRKMKYFSSALFRSIFMFPGASIIHVHSSVGPSLLRKSVLIWLARLCRCRVILHLQATKNVFEEFFKKDGLLVTYSRRVMRRCDRIVVLSEILKDVVAKVVPDSEISVIYNPVVRLQGVQRGKEAEEPSVLYLAHVVCRKGYQDLIKAFAHVADTYISARLILCGSGEIDSAKELCESFGILENVEFKGWVYGAEKAQAFIEAMVFFLPSYDEGLPMSVLEAMSCRILIVATPVGGIPNILKDGENALLFGSGNCQELAEKIRSLFADEDLRVRPTTAAYEKGRNFEVTQAAREWLGVYRSIHVRN